MKPAQLLPGLLILAFLSLEGVAFGQAADSEPAATAPAPPPPPVAPAADLPPPPPPRASQAPQGKLVISAPPVPPAMARAGYHVHDGFYLRLAVGLGGGHGSVTSDAASAPHFGNGGGGLAFNAWVGGTPWRGVALGGLLSLAGMHDGSTVVEGSKTGLGSQGGLLLLAPFIDSFPDPLRGLHVGGALGLAGYSVHGDSRALSRDYAVKDYDGGGFGGSVWVGYGGWVGPEWSLGGLLQLTGFGTAQKDGVERRASGYALNVSFTALYH